MVKLPLLLAALSAAALALPAAAQSDAAFASALGTPPSGLATLAQLKAQPQAPAQDPPMGPPVAHDAWMRIINLMRAKAKYTGPDAKGLSEWRLSEKSSDPRAEYVLMTVVFVGRTVGDNIGIGVAFFSAFKATATTTEVVAESWSFSTDYLGRVKRAVYQRTTKRLDGSIHVEAGVPVDFADPRIAARFASIIKYWSK